MAYPGNFLKLVLSGTMYGTEIWSTSLSIIPSFGAGAPNQTDQLDPYIVAARAWFGRANSKISPQAKLTSVKLNMVGPDGKYVDAGGSIFKEVKPIHPGNGGGMPPAQNTLAITLRTDAGRGLASRGRVFPPLCSPQVQLDGRIENGDADMVAQSFRDFINQLNALDNGAVGVASAGSPTKGLPGRFLPVKYVEVGMVIDTQRRRRNALNDKVRVRPAADVVLPPNTGRGVGGSF